MQQQHALKVMQIKASYLHGVDFAETCDSKDDPFMKVKYEKPAIKYIELLYISLKTDEN